MSAIQNRLEKNYRKLKPWSDRNRFEAFRLYDRDIPEFPYIIDIYKDYVLVYDKSDVLKDAGKNHLPPTLEAIKTLLKTEESKLIIKRRVRQEGDEQYEKLNDKDHEFAIQENQFKFYVNLWDYLDTGLFLDHRPSRYKIFQKSAGKRVLNLFSYTGSISVAAALGGASVTSIDLSNTYIEWAKRNFELNKIKLNDHSFLQADVLQFLQNDMPHNAYDLIFLDPPTFSNSKRMNQILDIEKVHSSTPDGKEVSLAVIIETIKVTITKKGDKMGLLKLRDYSGYIEVAIFPETYKKYKELLIIDIPLVVRGKVSTRNNEKTLVIDEVKKLEVAT